jgi:hypothetical protein
MIFLEKYGKMGHLINSLFFRETGEHVGNMFFTCPHSTRGLGEFSKEGGDLNLSDMVWRRSQ